MSTIESTARHVEMDSENYHRHPAIGSSMLETFRNSRREFYGRFVSKEIPPKEPTDAMKLGTLVHLALLEPDKFAETVVTMPNLYLGEEWNWRKPAHREARDAMQSRFAAEGKSCVELVDYETIQAMVAAIHANKYAHKLVTATGLPEYSIFWTDEETGLELKCRVDWWATNPLDIKTTNDPSPEGFARTATQLGYFRKAAHYATGIESLTGKKAQVVMLAVENKLPHRVANYDLNDNDQDGRSLGRRQWRENLNALARCIESGDWLEPWEKSVIELRPPGWAFTSDCYQVGD